MILCTILNSVIKHNCIEEGNMDIKGKKCEKNCLPAQYCIKAFLTYYVCNVILLPMIHIIYMYIMHFKQVHDVGISS